jgi:hypothetical protein
VPKEALQCCAIGCLFDAVYEIWYHGQPTGLLDAYDLFDGVARYECYTHACAQHLEELKSGYLDEVVHLSRTCGAIGFSVARVEPGN